ncbi:tyrosine-type recombinase/integrase [Vibrio parahaemolyticus]|uniref:tyrosine-type recombinase/integrase n=2 Tax=Vibrio parahaemolyticus TaxID=670 RepID=UPI00215BFEFD|nr:tyrosine-type recombinase/integrase [Vibrio parahaemolyticus]EIW7480652.1 tyrosine-type recombinase/integrase [Vibrio parahaemolyticus]EKZ9250320.1 tyrosine-type recombinase/integrase [Vibrio parahaemolyticus]ELA6679510.1 tyrosine-type recombinase/integrase [Vibrio parahaemolyticus]ELA7318512.1 tyrosine-type recombinase/integrase [Vibrio parahaemolyticus]ELI6472125.1 tyrosine-type recombinase/integrase [Vibrio parahaemolyticus]
MYLIKLSNNVFYTRISTPAILQTSLGYPREIRLSLFTKYRRLATKRNAQLASAIHTLHEQALAENIPYTDFKISLSTKVAEIRQQFCSNLPHVDNPQSKCTSMSIETRAMPAPAPEESVNSRLIGAQELTTELNNFIRSKRLEQVTPLTLTQLNQRCTNFLSYLAKQEICLSAKAANTYRDHLIEKGLSAKTVKEYIAANKQFFDYCERIELIEKNVFKAIKAPKSRVAKASQQRDRWQLKELKKLFSSSEYRKKEVQFNWTTKIQLYHGCRPSEVCQLTTSDIQIIEGVPCITISDSEADQRLKTSNALRIVPLHNQLINEGFLEYVQGRREQKQKQLFDYKPHGDNKDWSFRYRTNLGKLQTAIGMKPNARPTAYSFRHTFIDELKIADIPEHIVAEIVGHAHPNITFGRYGKQAKIHQLHEAVNKFPAVEVKYA